ncbi:hypothetical protein [Flectobacillus major]|uniref:hypothetical protein n=1 Tax=Flectobacillus major TaxID=103 RepID=UPI0004135723|nr:hypothetical protein [Flectobacillus major]
MRITLGLLMTLAGIGHLTFQRQEFLAQVPSWLPQNAGFMDFVVLSSGVIEIALGLAMIFFAKQKVVVGLLLALFYVLIFPGNISQYVNDISAFGLDTQHKRLIRLFFQPVLVMWALWATGALKYLIQQIKEKESMKNTSFYDLSADDIKGKPRSMSEFQGKVIVVVNTASKCGLTPQFEGLEALYQKYKDRGLVILGFPCNQFANQEKGSSEEILEFCQMNYGVSFPMFSKIDVNGLDAHPIFTFLKAKLGFFLFRNIKWNFTKFVIDKNGKPVKRFSPIAKPESMDTFIEKLL